jgi:hypothetical protein
MGSTLIHLLVVQYPDSFSFPPGPNELHCSLSIGGILLLTQTQCVGKSGGISPVLHLWKKIFNLTYKFIFAHLF